MQALRGILPGAVAVKIGTGTYREDCDIPLYPPGTALDDIRHDHAAARYLVVESNSILSQVVPDLLIYLPGERKAKPSAARAAELADLTGGGRVACADAKGLARRLEITPAQFRGILDAAGIKICSCEFGIF